MENKHRHCAESAAFDTWHYLFGKSLTSNHRH